MQVNHSVFNAAMAQEFLNCNDIYPVLKQMCGVSVTKHVGVYFFVDTSLPGHCFYGPLHTTLTIPAIKILPFGVTGAFK